MTAPQTIHTEHKLHINSVVGYWSTFRAVLHTAYREHKIMENPNGFWERIDDQPDLYALRCKEFLCEQDSIRNFKFQPDTGSIMIDEPDKGDYHFHFE